MLNFFRPDPKKKLQEQYEKLLYQAMQFQRNGDIKSYSMVTAEAEKIHDQIKKLQA